MHGIPYRAQEPHKCYKPGEKPHNGQAASSASSSIITTETSTSSTRKQGKPCRRLRARCTTYLKLSYAKTQAASRETVLVRHARGSEGMKNKLEWPLHLPASAISPWLEMALCAISGTGSAAGQCQWHYCPSYARSNHHHHHPAAAAAA
eukprot:scpid39824/ scgid29463/ 